MKLSTENFEEFPLNFYKPVNLCYLDFTRTKVSKIVKDIGILKNIEILCSFYVDKGREPNIQPLKKSNLHGKTHYFRASKHCRSIQSIFINFENLGFPCEIGVNMEHKEW